MSWAASRGRLGRPVEPIGEAASLDVFHFKIRAALTVAEGEDLDNVGMVQPRDRFGFSQETQSGFGRRVMSGKDHLDRDDAIEPQLASLVDNAHSATA